MKKILSAVMLFSALAGPALAEGVVADGENLFKKCKSCHAIGEGAKDKIGPELNDLLGRTAGSLESFDKKYSKAMKAKGEEGLVWTAESLTTFLADPKKLVKGTKMSFAGFKAEQDIEDIVAYLAKFSPDYVHDDSSSDEAVEAQAPTN